MKQMLYTFGLALFISTIITSFALADEAGDWEKMDKLLDEGDRYQSYTEFEGDPTGFVIGWLEHKEKFSKQFNSFKEKYGSEQKDAKEKFENIDPPSDECRKSYQLISDLYNYDIEQRNKSILEWAERSASQSYRGWESLKNPSDEKYELKLKRAEKALEMYKLADQLDPDGEFGEMVKKAKAAVKETEPQVKKALENKTWPTPNPDYKGSDSSEKLANAALEFLSKKSDWTKPVYDDVHNPYAAVVTGSGWEVYKEAPLTRDPLQYSIDILVAFTGEKDPDIAYVYHMVFYTAEEKGVKKELPFKFVNARQYAQFKMLKKNIKKNGGSGGSGGFGLFRLLMSISLIAGGMISAKPMLLKKLPQVTSVVALLENLSLPIGAFLILLGAGGFLCNLMRFAPLASILPQATAALLGTLFIKKSFNIGFLAKLTFLEPLQLPLGIAGICLGFLHLIMGGMGLF